MRTQSNKIKQPKQTGAKTNKVLVLLTTFLFLFIANSFLLAPVSDTTPETMQGAVYEMEMTDFSVSPLTIDQLLIELAQKNVAMTMTSSQADRQGKFIFRGDRGEQGEMIICDESDQTYYIFGDEFMGEMEAQMSQMEQQMQEVLKHMSKEEREAFEKMMKKNTEPGLRNPEMPLSTDEFELINTGIKANKKGYHCSKYEYRRNGKVIREIWLTDWSKVEGGAMAKVAFGAMGTFFKKFETSRPSMYEDKSFYEELNFENGFPVVVSYFDKEGNLETKTTLESAEKRNFPSDTFDPPAGYKMKKSPFQGQ